MMSVQPEMIRQLARHLAARFEAKGHHNVKVCAEAFVALNGRRSRPLIDPAVDLAEGFSLAPNDWIQPLNKLVDIEIDFQYQGRGAKSNVLL
jgi:hypothetical protein